MFKITVEERNWNDIKQEQAVEIILLGVMDDHVNIQHTALFPSLNPDESPNSKHNLL